MKNIKCKLSKRDTPFLKIAEASKVTGLSQYFLRSGCRDGSVPHIRVGPKYMINVPAFFRKLGSEDRDDAPLKN